MQNKILVIGGLILGYTLFKLYDNRLDRSLNFSQYLSLLFNLVFSHSKKSEFANIDYINIAIFLKQKKVI